MGKGLDQRLVLGLVGLWEQELEQEKGQLMGKELDPLLGQVLVMKLGRVLGLELGDKSVIVMEFGSEIV
jgi:hypothetical protein